MLWSGATKFSQLSSAQFVTSSPFLVSFEERDKMVPDDEIRIRLPFVFAPPLRIILRLPSIPFTLPIITPSKRRNGRVG